jgi:hypothetical protein
VCTEIIVLMFYCTSCPGCHVQHQHQPSVMTWSLSVDSPPALATPPSTAPIHTSNSFPLGQPLNSVVNGCSTVSLPAMSPSSSTPPTPASPAVHHPYINTTVASSLTNISDYSWYGNISVWSFSKCVDSVFTANVA